MYIEENRQQIISPDSVPRRGVGGKANSFVGVQRTVGDFAKNFDSISVQKGAVPILYAIGRQREATAVDIFLPYEAINGRATLLRSFIGPPLDVHKPGWCSGCPPKARREPRSPDMFFG